MFDIQRTLTHLGTRTNHRCRAPRQPPPRIEYPASSIESSLQPIPPAQPNPPRAFHVPLHRKSIITNIVTPEEHPRRIQNRGQSSIINSTLLHPLLSQLLHVFFAPLIHYNKYILRKSTAHFHKSAHICT